MKLTWHSISAYSYKTSQFYMTLGPGKLWTITTLRITKFINKFLYSHKGTQIKCKLNLRLGVLRKT